MMKPLSYLILFPIIFTNLVKGSEEGGNSNSLSMVMERDGRRPVLSSRLSSGTMVKFKGMQNSNCNNQGPFEIDHDDWWRCDSDAMKCYNFITLRVMKNVHRSKCLGGTCLSTPSNVDYGKSLQKTLMESLEKQESLPPPPTSTKGSSSCPWAQWTSEMDYVANIILQKSKQCQIDYTAIFVLFDATERLFALEEKCLKAGMEIPGDDCEELDTPPRDNNNNLSAALLQIFSASSSLTQTNSTINFSDSNYDFSTFDDATLFTTTASTIPSSSSSSSSLEESFKTFSKPSRTKLTRIKVTRTKITRTKPTRTKTFAPLMRAGY